jgi:SAM-dependent methyltransferase
MSIGDIDADAFSAFEAAGWNEQAIGYHRFFRPITTRLVEPLLDAAGVGHAARVLDVATGPGYVAAAAAGRGAAAVGVDVAAQMADLARTLNPAVEFVVADAERLPFPDGSFDAVLGNLAIPHFARPERTAAELVRVLGIDGRIALTMWDVPERNRLLGVLVDAVAEVGVRPSAEIPAGPPVFRFSEDDELERLLAGAGVAGVDVETIAFTHRVGSAGELWEGLLAGTVRSRALVLGQPEEALSRVRETFERLAGEHEEGGGLEIPVSFKLAVGTKPADGRAA